MPFLIKAGSLILLPSLAFCLLMTFLITVSWGRLALQGQLVVPENGQSQRVRAHFQDLRMCCVCFALPALRAVGTSNQKAEPPGLFSYTFIGACHIVSVFLFIVVLGIQLRALCMLGQHFIRPHARSTAVLLGGNNMYVIRRLRNGIRITLHLQSP